MVPDVGETSDALDAAGARMIGSQGGAEGDIAWMHPKNPLALSLELLRKDFWVEAMKAG